MNPVRIPRLVFRLKTEKAHTAILKNDFNELNLCLVVKRRMMSDVEFLKRRSQ